MIRLGQKVVIVADKFEQKLPIGEYGYVIALDRNADSVFEYVVRVPKLGKNVLVTSEEIELESELLRKEAERVEREALIDFALATNNKELFLNIVNGESKKEENKQSLQSYEEFIRQVNLKAWI